MNPLTRISLVRHGHVYNPCDVFYGRLSNFALSGEGRHQAQAAAEVLRDKPFAAVFSSPRLRARQTAEIILTLHHSLTLQTSQFLDEVHTPFDGHPISEMAARNWDIYTGVGPQHEQPVDVLTRVRRFVSEVRQQYAGQHIIAVTHGDVVAFMILWALGMPATIEHKQSLRNLGFPENYPAPASISTFVYRTTSKNEVPSLEYVKPY